MKDQQKANFLLGFLQKVECQEVVITSYVSSAVINITPKVMQTSFWITV